MGMLVRIKIATVFWVSNKLPKATARPFSSRTSRPAMARIASLEGISRGLMRAIGVEMGERYSPVTVPTRHT